MALLINIRLASAEFPGSKLVYPKPNRQCNGKDSMGFSAVKLRLNPNPLLYPLKSPRVNFDS